MPNRPMNVNLARIVHRLLTNHRGWRVDDLMNELGIADRTYRKYRKLLQEEPVFMSGAAPLIHEVTDGDTKYLRLVEGQAEDGPRDPKAFASKVAALHFSQLLMGFLAGTDVTEALETLIENFNHGLHDRPFVLNHLLRNVDRVFYTLPDAPKDYSDKDEVISTLLRALIYTRRIRMGYSSANFDGLELTLEPLTLAVHRSALYLMARSVKHGDIRIYAVDRIHDIEVLNQKFDYPKRSEYDPEAYTEGSFGIFRSDKDEEHHFELIFDDERWLQLYIQERRWHPSQSFESLEDGRLRMTFTVNTDVEVWPWIRQFGDQVEVVQPAFEVERESAE